MNSQQSSRIAPAPGITHITRTVSVEDLVGRWPAAVRFLIQRDLPCLVCGEPAWGTLEDFARTHGRSDDEIDALVSAMNTELVRT